MKTHPFFPTDLTDEERAAGFHLVNWTPPSASSEVAVAVLPIAKSARLVKMREMPLFDGDTTVGYQIQIFASDHHFMIKEPKPPEWQAVGHGTSKTIEYAIHRFQTEPIDTNLKQSLPPDEPVVTVPERAHGCVSEKE